MIDAFTTTILVVFATALLVLPFVVNGYFQLKAARFSDELLLFDLAEHNRQIKARAIALLVRRSLWGLWFLLLAILNFRSATTQSFYRHIPLMLVVAAVCFAFGVWSFKNEIKRLKRLE